MAKIRYNSERLNAVIKDFCIMTNVSVSVVDTDFVTLATYSERTPRFCKEIQKSQKGWEKCYCSDMELLKKCSESRRTESHLCHAGILDAIMPIINSDKIIAYIIIGRTRVNKFDKKKIKWLDADFKLMKKLYYEMTEYDDRQINSMFEIASMIVSFILTNEIITPVSDDFSEEVKDYIENNLNADLSVDALCNKFNVSKNYLYEKFRSSFSVTVNKFVIEKRLQKGEELLKDTELSMSSISEEIGIGSYTYFSRLFKSKYGCAPLAFRKINKKNFEKTLDNI